MGSFKVRYTQETELEGNAGPLQPLAPTVEAIYNKTAAVKGLLASLSQREAGKAMQVFTTLALYARPLVGDEFRLLHEHGLVSQADYGQLFSWLTKTGLADVLQISRPAVRSATTWLIEQQLIKAVEMPPAFIEQYVQRRGQFTADTVYVLSTNGALVTEFVPAREPGEVTVETELPRSTATVETELPRSEASPWQLSCRTMETKLPQSIKDHDHDHDDHRAREISPLMPQIQTAWQTALRSELSPENTQILAEMIAAGETHLPVIQGMLYLLAQRAADNPPETQFALLAGVLTGKTSLDWEPAPEAPPPASCNPLQTVENAPPVQPDGTLATSPATAPIPNSDPLLAQVTRWYESEIGLPLSDLVADELRDLTGRYRDLQAWKEAFTKAAPAHREISRWRYVVRCMEDTDGQFRINQPKTSPPASNGGNGGGDRRASRGAPASGHGNGGKRSRLRVTQSNPEERAPGRSPEEQTALEAQILAAAGLDPSITGGGSDA